MGKFTMDEFDAWMRMMHIPDSGMTTTLPSGAKPFYASTVSDSEAKEFTDSASILPNELKIQEMSLEDMERFCTEWQGVSESHISVFSVTTTMNPSQTKNSSNGSTGPSPEEVEP